MFFYVFVILAISFSKTNSDGVYDRLSEVDGHDEWWHQGLFQNTARYTNRKRDALSGSETEGGEVSVDNKLPEQVVKLVEKEKLTTDKPEININIPGNMTASNKTVDTSTIAGNDTKSNVTLKLEKPPYQMGDPGVWKRGAIVFGGFSILAIAYFIFYRRNSNKNDSGNSHNAPDAVQFRYGMLQSNDRDSMEFSRVPLTLDSEDEDDDDLEIFDLEQKKKSLSYGNLKSQSDDLESFSVLNDDSLVNEDERSNLIDIDDRNSDTLINLSGNSSKSIL